MHRGTVLLKHSQGLSGLVIHILQNAPFTSLPTKCFVKLMPVTPRSLFGSAPITQNSLKKFENVTFESFLSHFEADPRESLLNLFSC